MKHIRKLIVCLIAALLSASCSSAKKPPTYGEIMNAHPSQSAEEAAGGEEQDGQAAVAAADAAADPDAAENARLREENAAAVAAILSENQDADFAVTAEGTRVAALCDGGIYINTGWDVRLLNRRTGFLQGLCSDPLCRHESCVESLDIMSMVSDGDKLYFKGFDESWSSFSGWDKSSFVASYDPDSDKFEMLDVWEKDRGSTSSVIGLDGGNLYYTKKMDEDTNSLYRIPKNGGRAERLTPKGEFVQQFAVCGERIFYTTQEYTLKSMDMDGTDVETLGEFVCMVFFEGEKLFAISAKKEEKGYAVLRNEEPLPICVFAPVWTTFTADALWYTVPDKRTLGTYVDESGRTQTIKTDNGTAFYGYDLKTGEVTAHECSFACGIAQVCGRIGDYCLVMGITAERAFGFWIFDPADASKAYRLYDYES